MKQLHDPVWQRRGMSWLWDAQARNHICAAEEIWSLRRFLQADGHWPDDLPSNNNCALVVGGLDGCLDLLIPEDAENCLDAVIKPAVLSFQDYYQGEAALVFWLPDAYRRFEITITDEVFWLCHTPHDHKLDFGRTLWGQTNEYPQEIILSASGKPVGLYHARIT